jgi:hypothetical protein
MQTDWIIKQDAMVCCLQETHLKGKGTETESELIENNIPSKWNLNLEYLFSPIFQSRVHARISQQG